VREPGGSGAGQPARAGRGHGPYHGRHAQFVNGGWLEGQESCLSRFQEFKSSLVWQFKLFQEFVFFQEFCKILKNSQVWLQTGHRIVKKNCIVYGLFCISVIIIVILIISSSINISFVVLLNSLDLNPLVLPFVHPTAGGEGEG